MIEHPVSYTLSADTTVCQNDRATLAVYAPEGTTYQWTDNGSGQVLGTTASIRVTPEAAASYTVTLTSGVCPAQTGTITVDVTRLPEITEIELLHIREVRIHTSADGSYPYLYRIDSEDFVSDDILTARTYGKHTYTVRDANGCETSRSFTITPPAINPPLVFTPDGNGENDAWEVPGLAEAYPNSVITIFDRFGKRLVEINASEGGWDGTYLGKPMPATDYWYEISVEEIDKVYVGHFTLLRR